MKITTVCHAGLIRSVAMAEVLKKNFLDLDVIPIGIALNSFQTKEMIFEWADTIILMEKSFEKNIPLKYHHKIQICDVGEDTYGDTHHIDLVKKIHAWCSKHYEILGVKEYVTSRDHKTKNTTDQTSTLG